MMLVYYSSLQSLPILPWVMFCYTIGYKQYALKVRDQWTNVTFLNLSRRIVHIRGGMVVSSEAMKLSIWSRCVTVIHNDTRTKTKPHFVQQHSKTWYFFNFHLIFVFFIEMYLYSLWEILELCIFCHSLVRNVIRNSKNLKFFTKIINISI